MTLQGAPVRTAAAWIDLLGYGAAVREAHFDFAHSAMAAAVERLQRFQDTVRTHVFTPARAIVLNDGVLLMADFESRGALQEFLHVVAVVHAVVNELDSRGGHPGARSVICCGQRLSLGADRSGDLMDLRAAAQFHGYTLDTESDDAFFKSFSQFLWDHGHDLRIFPYRAFEEIQLNAAFAKAYLADELGRSGGLGGPQLYIEEELLVGAFGDAWTTCLWTDTGHVWKANGALLLMLPVRAGAAECAIRVSSGEGVPVCLGQIGIETKFHRGESRAGPLSFSAPPYAVLHADQPLISGTGWR